MFHGLVSLLVWLIAYTLFFGMPHITLLFLPLVTIPLLLFIMGLSWGLAALGVFLRDISQIIGVITTALLFLSPIFYSASSLPERYQIFLQLNPLTPIVEQTRGVLFFGKPPEMDVLLICYLCSVCVAWLGFAWFQKTRKGFADVL